MRKSRTTRHVLFHVCPVAADGGECWRWNVAELKAREAQFAGRKVAAVVTDAGRGFSVSGGKVSRAGKWALDPADAVREALGGGWEVIEFPNDPRLREVATWEPLWSRLEEFAAPDHTAFYCHSKGVRHGAPHIRDWTRIMYAANLDDPLAVDESLARFPITGAFKKVGRGWPEKSASRWHFSGTFFHVRLDDFFARNWRGVEPFWSGTEHWPGVAYRPDEGGSLFLEAPVREMNLYDPGYVYGTVLPAWERRAGPKEG